MSYETDLNIDEGNLDEEWLQQAQRYQKYSELLADAELERANLKEEVVFLRAQLELKIRSGKVELPEGLKLTDKSTAAVVESDVSVREKELLLNKAAHEVNILKGAVEAFAQRKKALEKLVDLFVFAYNAEPKDDRVDRVREIKRQRSRV